MNSILTQARKYCREGKSEKALRSIRFVSDYDFDYWIALGEINLSLKRFKDADEAISQAIHISNTDAYAWHLKAKACIGLVDYNKALRASERALAMEDNDEYRKLKMNIQGFLDMDDFSFENHANRYDNMVELTNRKNIELLSERKLNEHAYRLILDGIVCDAVKSTDNAGDIFTKIKNFTLNFVDIDFDFESRDLGDKRMMMGAYGFNRIGIDSRMVTILKISIMIHELAHHMLSEIFKQTMMYVYDSEKTDTIEAFSWYCITRDVYWYLMNEYVAHRVECHYMPYSYENYESFNLIVSRHDNLDEDKVKKAVELANSLADDIIYMMDKFITEPLKEEIRLQYLADRLIMPKKKAQIKSDGKLDGKEKFEMINTILRQNLMYVKINLSYSQLYRFKRIFSYVNSD